MLRRPARRGLVPRGGAGHCSRRDVTTPSIRHGPGLRPGLPGAAGLPAGPDPARCRRRTHLAGRNTGQHDPLHRTFTALLSRDDLILDGRHIRRLHGRWTQARHPRHRHSSAQQETRLLHSEGAHSGPFRPCPVILPAQLRRRCLPATALRSRDDHGGSIGFHPSAASDTAIFREVGINRYQIAIKGA